jgi:RNase P/RNase MRP subunit POP5
MMRFSIIQYVGVSSYIEPDNAERLNKQLKEWNGKIPEGEDWGGCGHGSTAKIVAEFDNEGNRISITEYNDPHLSGFVRVRTTELKKVFEPVNWNYIVYRVSRESVTQSKEASNLYNGNVTNNFGQSVKSALYHAIPKNAKNIRIKRGNGIINCDTYSFAYVDRYVAEDERIVLDYSFLKD